MNQPYIYESNKNQEVTNSTEAIVVLPDIYCQTDYAKNTINEFAEEFGKPVFMLDYFYIGTNHANCFGEQDRDQVHQLMESLIGDQFVEFFQKAITEIQQAYPSITQIIVIGFCFGGRLAYIAGGEVEVVTVVSFYGAGAHAPNYVAGQTPIQYLVSKRADDSGFKVISFYGSQDDSIPLIDREQTKVELGAANISYQGHEYDAGHAYFQEGRPNFNKAANSLSWEVLRKIIQ